MRRTEMMTAGGVTLAGLGVLVGLAVGSGATGPKLIAQRTQPVEVRTEVIRKTVNVYRRTKPHHLAAGSGGSGSGSVGGPSAGAAVAPYGATRTRSSGRGAAVPIASAAPQTVKTRSSGASPSGGGSVSSKAVTTKSSGGGHDDRGGNGD